MKSRLSKSVSNMFNGKKISGYLAALAESSGFQEEFRRIRSGKLNS